MFSTLLGALPLSGSPGPRPAPRPLTRLRTIARRPRRDRGRARLDGAARRRTTAPGSWTAGDSPRRRRDPVKRSSRAHPRPRGRPSDPPRSPSAPATILALAAAGCPFVEIAEPDALAIAIVPAAASVRRRASPAGRRDEGLHCSLALTGGNVDGRRPAALFDLAYASYAFDLIAGPDNWRLIARRPADRGIICGRCPRAGADEPARCSSGRPTTRRRRRTRPRPGRPRERPVARRPAGGRRATEARGSSPRRPGSRPSSRRRRCRPARSARGPAPGPRAAARGLARPAAPEAG